MNPVNLLKRQWTTPCTVLGLMLTPAVIAQPVPPAAQSSSPTIELSPFEVSSERDYGYTAHSSLAGGRLTTALDETPSSLTVLTREFLDDISAANYLEAAEWAVNASSPYTAEGDNLFNDFNVNFRNLGSSFQARNYFIWYVNSDDYNTERIEFARGPNSVVFGDANVGGMANVNTKRAQFRDFGSASARISSYGGEGRYTLDLNKKVTDTFALRFNGLLDRTENWQDRARNDREGLFLTTLWRPFKNTSVRAEGEWGHIVRVLGDAVADSYTNWDGVTVVNGPLSANLPAATGISRRTNDYLVLNIARPEEGLLNWRNFGTTTGTLRSLEPRIPRGLPSDFPVLPYYGYHFRAPNAEAENDFHNYSVFVEHQVGDNLFLEAAYNHQEQYRYIDRHFYQNLTMEVNRVLPTGGLNPYFGELYADANSIFEAQGNVVDDFRVSAAYLFENDFLAQRMILVAGRRDDFFEVEVSREGRTNGSNPDMFNGANLVIYRVYESDVGTKWSPALSTGAVATRYGVQQSRGQERELTYLQFASSGSWLPSRRLHTVLGLRRDELKRFDSGANTLGVNRDVITRGALGPAITNAVTTGTAGLVYDLSKSVSLVANYGESFQPSGAELGIDGRPLDPLVAEGVDVGLQLSLFDERVTGRVTYYWNRQSNRRTGGAASEINRIWEDLQRSERVQDGYSDTFAYEGSGLEFDFTANLTRNWRLLFNFALPEAEQNSGFEATRTYFDANIDTWRAGAAAEPDALIRQRINANIAGIESDLEGFAEGRLLNGGYDYTANIFSRYRFSEGWAKGLTLGAGANFRGDRLVTNVPGNAFDYIYSNGYVLVKLTVGYQREIWGREFTFNLDISNALDEPYQRYYRYRSQGGEFYPDRFHVQNPRRILFTTRVAF